MIGAMLLQWRNNDASGERSALDNDLRAKPGQTVELLGEGHRQPNASVACRVAGIGAAVERDPIFVEALHERHGRVVVFLRTIEAALFEDRPEAERRHLALLRARDRRRSD